MIQEERKGQNTMKTILDTDIRVMIWMQNSRRQWITAVLRTVSAFSDFGIFWIALVLVLYRVPKYSFLAEKAGLSLIMNSLLINLVLKRITARERPFQVYPFLEPLIRLPKDWSFPSGHTGAAFACTMVLIRFLPADWGFFLLTLAVLTGYSRVYLGVHYPSDILAGALLGVLTAAIALRL